MKYLAAYLLSNLTDKQPTAASIEKILKAAGIESDKKQVDLIISELSGKSLPDVIASGNAKLASVPSGGSGPVAATSGGSAQQKVEEVVEEAKEESDDDMGFGLFD